MWPELAEKYSDKPRLASMLTSSTLSIEMDGDYKVVTFRVVNEAQKDWVESKLLHELESTLRILVESAKVNLRVSVVPDEPAATKKAYMPSEQAKELMDQNAEVKSLVQDLGLDIK
jgi:chromosomal replication initiation ATPase DnaA